MPTGASRPPRHGRLHGCRFGTQLIFAKTQAYRNAQPALTSWWQAALSALGDPPEKQGTNLWEKTLKFEPLKAQTIDVASAQEMFTFVSAEDLSLDTRLHPA